MSVHLLFFACVYWSIPIYKAYWHSTGVILDWKILGSFASEIYFLFGFVFFPTTTLNTNNNIYSKNIRILLIDWIKKKNFLKNRTASLFVSGCRNTPPHFFVYYAQIFIKFTVTQGIHCFHQFELCCHMNVNLLAMS